MTHSDTTPKHQHQREAFALALAQGASQQEAAARAGIHRNTAHAWEKEAAVKRTIEEVRQAARERAVRRLNGMADRAVRTVGEIMSRREWSRADRNRLAAALATLKMLGLDKAMAQGNDQLVVVTRIPREPIDVSVAGRE